MADKDYYSFEEVLRNLKLEEAELKRLVSAGEIRAFRDQDTMRFKAEDVEKLRRPDGVDELELDDLELDLDLDDEPAVRTSARGADVDELLLEDDPVDGEVEEIDLAAESAADEPAGARTRGGRAARGAAATASRRPARAEAGADAEGETSAGLLVALVAGVALLVFANLLVFDAVAGRVSNPLSRTVAGLFGN